MPAWKALRQTMFSAFVKSQRHRQLLGHAALLVAYVLTGWIGLYLAVPPGYATAIFLPAGIAGLRDGYFLACGHRSSGGFCVWCKQSTHDLSSLFLTQYFLWQFTST
jgi:hypothetical protein